MPVSQIASIMQDGIFTMIIVSAPVLIVGLVVGVIISIFQATTQINEQTMVFVPKILSIFISLIFFGPWMGTKLMEFTTRLFDTINVMMR